MSAAISILLHHRIDDTGSALATAPRVFRRPMRWLSERGWHPLTPDHLGFHARSGRERPSHSFLSTAAAAAPPA